MDSHKLTADQPQALPLCAARGDRADRKGRSVRADRYRPCQQAGLVFEVSPLGKVPVLLVETEDGEVALFESNVICEYIEDTQGGAKLHPQDPLQRAQHRAWMEFGSTILSELWGLETTGDPAVFETKRKAVAAKFAQVEKTLGAGPFFAGEEFQPGGRGVRADLPLFRCVRSADRSLGVRRYAEGRAWRKALAQRPSVRAAVGPTIRNCCTRSWFVTTRTC